MKKIEIIIRIDIMTSNKIDKKNKAIDMVDIK
jgi:hypothetical protein